MKDSFDLLVLGGFKQIFKNFFKVKLDVGILFCFPVLGSLFYLVELLFGVI